MLASNNWATWTKKGSAVAAGFSTPNRRWTRRWAIVTTPSPLRRSSACGGTALRDKCAPAHRSAAIRFSGVGDRNVLWGAKRARGCATPKPGAASRNVEQRTIQSREQIVREFMLWDLMAYHISNCSQTLAAQRRNKAQSVPPVVSTKSPLNLFRKMVSMGVSDGRERH